MPALWALVKQSPGPGSRAQLLWVLRWCRVTYHSKHLPKSRRRKTSDLSSSCSCLTYKAKGHSCHYLTHWGFQILENLPWLLYLNNIILERKNKSKPGTEEFYSFCFPGSSDGKESVCNVGDWGSIPGLGRSPGKGNANPFQYSCLQNPMDEEAWWAHKESDMTEQLTQHFHSFC